MIDLDESLKDRMTEALLSGNKEEAVRLSQELDKQVVQAQKCLNNKLKGGIGIETAYNR